MLTILIVNCSSVNDINPEESDQTSMPAVSTAANKPVINYFTAHPEILSAGQSTTLRWSISGATSATIYPIDQNVDSTGSQQLSPAITTTYSLIASNETGNNTSTVSVIVTSNEDTIVSYDPVTGRNKDIGFTWEQLCLADEYQIQIAKDPAFTMVVFDSGVFAPDSSTSPALLYMAGGRLEAGHKYYWRARVRQTATGQAISSPWSEVETFTVSSGMPVTTPYYGIQLLNPDNNCIDYPITPVPFSWTPIKSTVKYKFILAEDAGLSDIITIAETGNTSYMYEGELEYNTVYFWQVTAIDPVISEPSATFNFVTEVKPLSKTLTIEKPPATPNWAWAIIGLGIALIIIILFIIFKITRVSKQ